MGLGLPRKQCEASGLGLETSAFLRAIVVETVDTGV
jgi:hypothetical protein